MDFDFLESKCDIRDAVKAICNRFDDAYWRDRDSDGKFPFEFRNAIAEAGWLGLTMPEEYGGAGLGVSDAAVMMHTIANSGGGMAAASSIHINMFGPHPITVFGTNEQKARWIPKLVDGSDQVCFGVTEPDAGLNTTNIKTFAKKVDGGYLVSGRKMWTSTAQVSNKIMLAVRTTKKEDCAKPTDGLSLFYTDFDREKIEVRRIDKMGRKAVDSNAIFIDDYFIPDEDLLGEEGKGFRYLLHSLNPERVMIAAEAVGLGQDALARATQYAKERIVFDRPIVQAHVLHRFAGMPEGERARQIANGYSRAGRLVTNTESDARRSATSLSEQLIVCCVDNAETLS